MTDLSIRAVTTAAHRCAMAMMENATYIQGELPNVQMDDQLRARTAQLCSDLVGTKHDIVSEVAELDELLASGASPSDVTARVGLIVQWLRHDVEQMNELVRTLDAASERDPECTLAFLLVAGSATNILEEVNRVEAAADALRALIPS